MNDPLTTLLRRYVAADEREAQLDREHKLAKRDAGELQRLVWEHLDDAGLDYGCWDLGEELGRVQFTKQQTVRAQVTDKKKARAALEAMGLADVLFDELGALRQKALNDHVKEWIRSEAPFPEGINFFTTRYVTITHKPDRTGGTT